jgi:hypothetical protein
MRDIVIVAITTYILKNKLSEYVRISHQAVNQTRALRHSKKTTFLMFLGSFKVLKSIEKSTIVKTATRVIMREVSDTSLNTKNDHIMISILLRLV